MKVVSPYEELKIWFSLESYEQLKSLTIKELHTELAFRKVRISRSFLPKLTR